MRILRMFDEMKAQESNKERKNKKDYNSLNMSSHNPITMMMSVQRMRLTDPCCDIYNAS